MQRLIPTCGINNGSGSLKKTKTFVELLRTEAAFEAWLKFSCPPRRLDGGVWKGSLWHLINPAAWSCTGLWDWEWATESVLRVFMLVCLTLSPWENTKGGGGKTLSSCHISCSDRSGVKLISVFTPDWTNPVMGHYNNQLVLCLGNTPTDSIQHWRLFVGIFVSGLLIKGQTVRKQNRGKCAKLLGIFPL